MPKIQRLSIDVIARIAAGEIIERPSFVIKELIENAIDAVATRISIDITDGGKEKIIVTDNGEGMLSDDLLLSVEPHTTSKIDPYDDLTQIKTYGFRGEALASIGSISRMTISSRAKKDHIGTMAQVDFGVLTDTHPIGRPEGTTVIVTDLFAKTPARKKFLKSTRSELRYILDTIIAEALPHPNISFFVRHNGKTILDLPSGELVSRLPDLIGPYKMEKMYPLSFQDSYISVHGYFSHPDLATSDTSRFLLFVNNRPIHDGLITTAVREAYGHLLERETYPICILFITIPYEYVDINIHPRKTAVTFWDNATIFSSIKQGVIDAIRERSAPLSQFLPGTSAKGVMHSLAADTLGTDMDLFSPTVLDTNVSLWQLHKTYILQQTKEGLLIVDQHAAHERILYEELCQFFSEKVTQDRSNVSLLLQLSASDKEVLKDNLAAFNRLGFHFGEFGSDIKIESIPSLFQDRDIVSILLGTIDDIRQDKTEPSRDTLTEKMLTFMACRSAVKAGEPMTEDEARALLERLNTTENNTSCPHGRPTFILLPITDLHKKFKRSQT